MFPFLMSLPMFLWLTIEVAHTNADANVDKDKGCLFQASTSAAPPYYSLLDQLQAPSIARVMEHQTISGHGYFVFARI